MKNRIVRLLLLLVFLGSHSALAEEVATKSPDIAAGGSDFSGLASDDFDRIVAGIERLGASKHPRALVVLEGLEAGQLVFDSTGTLFLRTGGRTVNAETGEAATPREKPRDVGVNNRVRRTLAPMISRLRLRAPDLEVRRTAAEETSKHPREDMRVALLDARKQESDDDVAELLDLALARLDLASDDKERRLSALAVIADQAELSFKGDLEGLLAKKEGRFVEPDADVRRGASKALSSIETKTILINAVANTFYGLSLGSVLLLAALGLAITFGLMHVINMAHGEMLMIGAYATFVVQSWFAASFPGAFDWYLVVAIPTAFVSCALVGMGLERFVVRHLYGRPLETLLATWGISLMLIQTIRLIFGAQNVTVANPSWLSGGFELMPNLVMPYSRLAIVAFTAAIVFGVALLLRKTTFGLQIRAVTQNRAMAASMGIPAKRIDLFTFGLGSGLAGLGGVAISQLGNVGPELGQGYIVDSFMVVVLGGVGKLMGAVIGAMGLGLLNKYVEPLAGAVLGKILILVFIVLFLQKRPQGLFALKGRAAEVV